MEPITSSSRRSFLRGSAALSAGLAGARLLGTTPSAAAQVLAGRPVVTHGVASGDVGQRSAIVWARADRPSRMVVEVAPTESFARPRILRGPIVDASSDFTGRLPLRGLPAGQDVHYRVRFEADGGRGLSSAPVAGRLRTGPADDADVSFVWSGDTAGQGWGINPDLGGMRLYETMRATQPDFFIHSGDTVYADGPLSETVALPDGEVWRNIVTPEKAKVAETLDEFRGQHRYNLLDDNVLRMNAEVPICAQWDDHETTNNWYPGEILTDPRYVVTDVNLLAARASRAFQEYHPIAPEPAEDGRVYRSQSYGPHLEVFYLDMRTYRGPNTENLQTQPSPETALLGERQLRWLEQRLITSRATWKVVASDMPIGLLVPDGPRWEAVANGEDGTAKGRELEIAGLLARLQRARVRDVVWVTADVHYTAAHHYDPSRAAFQDFDPFWEFVSGPINAGTFGPNALDGTFGPRVEFVRAAPTPNAPPSAGFQFFGHAAIDGSARTLTVSLRDVASDVLWSTTLAPESVR